MLKLPASYSLKWVFIKPNNVLIEFALIVMNREQISKGRRDKISKGDLSLDYRKEGWKRKIKLSLDRNLI